MHAYKGNNYFQPSSKQGIFKECKNEPQMLSFAVSWLNFLLKYLSKLVCRPWIYVFLFIVVDQLSSGVQLCDPMDCSPPGLPVPHHLLEFAQVHVRCFYLYFQLITALISVYTPSWLFCYCLNLVSFETTKHHFDFLPFLKSTVSQGCCMVEGPGISEAWVLSWFHGILWLAFSASICTFSFQSSGRAGRIHWQPIAWSCKKR